MKEVAVKLTLLFEEPFWIDLYEKECDGKYEVCKITFGTEPKNCEVYCFMLENWSKLRFSPSIELENVDAKHLNPKRIQREIHKQLNNTGIGTKAQQALKRQHEEGKIENKARSREQHAAEKAKNFEIKQAKRRAKHRGH